MSVYRKESNSLVPKAGLGIIDNIFNRFSSHAISNAKTTEALILISQSVKGVPTEYTF